MAFKTYVLLAHLNSSAPIYQRVNKDQRVRLEKLPVWRPYLQVTFQDKEGKNKTHRYKSTHDSVNQADQIKDGILANERFTTSERNDLFFNHGALTTNKVAAQRFLENYPGFEGFEGVCDEIPRPEFKLLDKDKEIKISNDEFKRRLQAANKIVDLNLKESKELLIRLNGSFYQTSENIEDNIDMLVKFMDATDEDGIEEILKDASETTVDDQNTILIGRLLGADKLEFDATSGDIFKIKAGQKIKIRDISNTYDLEERKRMLSEFLNTKDGKALKNDLEKDLRELDGEDEELVAQGNDSGAEEQPKRGRKPGK